MHTVISPSAEPYGLPRGGGGSEVLITTLSLFDPTDSMAVRPPGKQGNSCVLMVMAQGPDVTTNIWSRETIWDLFKVIPTAM